MYVQRKNTDNEIIQFYQTTVCDFDIAQLVRLPVYLTVTTEESVILLTRLFALISRIYLDTCIKTFFEKYRNAVSCALSL